MNNKGMLLLFVVIMSFTLFVPVSFGQAASSYETEHLKTHVTSSAPETVKGYGYSGSVEPLKYFETVFFGVSYRGWLSYVGTHPRGSMYHGTYYRYDLPFPVPYEDGPTEIIM